MTNTRARSRNLVLSPKLLDEACAQWQFGCPVFGLWAARHITPWGTHTYAQLIALVRAELGDDIDYSKQEPAR